MKSHSMPPRIYAKQGDTNSRVVHISLYAGGVAWEPGTNVKGVVQYRKPDGTGGAYDTTPGGATAKAVEISGNQITVNLAPQVLTAPGIVLCQVQLLNGSTVLTTFAWCIDVEEDALAGAISEDYYNVATLDSLAAQIKSLEAQIDQQLEPIETIKVTEAGVAAIERTQEPDGTPYRFSRLYITAFLPKPEASYQPRLWCMQDDIYLSGVGATPGNIGTNNNMYATQICGIEHGLWMTYGVTPQQGAAWSGAINTSIGYEPVLASKYPHCNRVKIAKSTGAAWEIGTIIKIYGVRT